MMNPILKQFLVVATSTVENLIGAIHYKFRNSQILPKQFKKFQSTAP